MSDTIDEHPPTDPEHARPLSALVALTREPQQLTDAETGHAVGATLQLVPPYERRVMTTGSGELVTGQRVALTTDQHGVLQVDLAAARTRMASVWDDRHTAPVALLRYADAGAANTDTEPSRPDGHGEHDVGHHGAVLVAADPFDYLYGHNPATTRYTNLETALIDIAQRLET